MIAELVQIMEIFTNYKKYAETYHVGESWSMGRIFIIWETWPVFLAMSLKGCIMFALFPPGRGSGWFACIVLMSILTQSELSCAWLSKFVTWAADAYSVLLAMIWNCFEFFVLNFSAFEAIDTSSSPCIHSKLSSFMETSA